VADEATDVVHPGKQPFDSLGDSDAALVHLASGSWTAGWARSCRCRMRPAAFGRTRQSLRPSRR
jgi:hypothetical protein